MDQEIHHIKLEITECKQKGMTTVNYIASSSNYGIIWQTMIICQRTNAESTSAILGSMLEKKREEERVNTFLMGLDETMYCTIRFNILAQHPFSNLNKVYSILV